MIKKIMYVTGALITLVFLEGIFTLGSAFEFEKYSAFAWVFQGIVVLFTVSFALYLEGLEDEDCIF